jgi:hypothetical protein
MSIPRQVVISHWVQVAQSFDLDQHFVGLNRRNRDVDHLALARSGT